MPRNVLFARLRALAFLTALAGCTDELVLGARGHGDGGESGGGEAGAGPVDSGGGSAGTGGVGIGGQGGSAGDAGSTSTGGTGGSDGEGGADRGGGDTGGGAGRSAGGSGGGEDAGASGSGGAAGGGASGSGGAGGSGGASGSGGAGGSGGLAGAGGSGGAMVVVQAIGADEHSCAVLSDGRVRCWGDGSDGKLGYGNTNYVATPALAGDVDVGGRVTQVALGGNHTCALLDTGKVRCWGNGESGQLGYGNQNFIGDNEAPASAGDIALGGNAIAIVAGNVHSCALLDTGKIRCWGEAIYGQLGYGAATNNVGDNETPASVGDVDVGGNAVHIAAGGFHNCVVLSTGAARCWGFNERGELGYGNDRNIGDDEAASAAPELDLGEPVREFTCAFRHTCALLWSGSVRCWGLADNGRLGYPGQTERVGDDESPTVLGTLDLGGTPTSLSAGSDHTCALLAGGSVRCWGYGFRGKLGYGDSGNVGDDETPAEAGAVNVGGAVRQIFSGLRHTCALLETGAVRCWGAFDALGTGVTMDVGDDELPSVAEEVDLL